MEKGCQETPGGGYLQGTHQRTPVTHPPRSTRAQETNTPRDDTAPAPSLRATARGVDYDVPDQQQRPL